MEKEDLIRNINPFGLRMQPQLKAMLEAEAKNNHRSLNAEIVARLESTFGERELRSVAELGELVHEGSSPDDLRKMLRLISGLMYKTELAIEKIVDNKPAQEGSEPVATNQAGRKIRAPKRDPS